MPDSQPPFPHGAAYPGYDDAIAFRLNGRQMELRNVDPTILLVDFLRFGAPNLTGTKLSCGEGGCGACTVVMARRDPVTDEIIERPISSCLRPLCSIDGASITTIEGVGSSRNGYNPIQTAVAEFNGSQCGYCTPGFVMNMYGLLRENRNPNAQEVEDHFDGNLCRCTGYRPILNAMQSFVGNPDAARAAGAPLPPDSLAPPRRLHCSGSGYEYFRPVTLADTLLLLKKFEATQATVKLMNGNSSVGIYKRDVYDPKILIDISRVGELLEITYEESRGLTVGGGVSFGTLLRFLTGMLADNSRSSTMKGYAVLHAHIRQIANEQVRNVASVAGNLMLAKNHERDGNPFPSDFLTVAQTLGALVHLRTPESDEQIHPIGELPAPAAFPNSFVITKVVIPPTPPSVEVQTYKVARRRQSSHALVNAGFRFEFDSAQSVRQGRIIFGGIGTLPVDAGRTAAFLAGKAWTLQNLRSAMPILRREIEEAIVAMPEAGIANNYRKSLCENLFKKYFIHTANSISPGEIPPRERSAGIAPPRPVSTGRNDFVLAPYYYKNAPVGTRTFQQSTRPGTQGFASNVLRNAPAALAAKVAALVPGADAQPASRENSDPPVIKDTAKIQATGEAKYTLDLAGPPLTVHAAYVYSEHRNAMFDYGAPGLAGLVNRLKGEFSGFCAYITEADIPHKAASDTFNEKDPGTYDPIFAAGRVTSFGQPIGLVIAATLREAHVIASRVQKVIRYEPGSLKAVTSIEEALAEPDGAGILSNKPHIRQIMRPGSDENWLSKPAAEEGKIFATGIQHTGAQAHFYLETNVCLAVPGEGQTMTIGVSAQYLAGCQQAIAVALGVAANKVEAKVSRLGGGFGAKELRPPFISAAAAVAAWKLGVPVRLAMDRNTDMIMIGKRHPFQGKFSILADKKGRIEKAKYEFWSDGGCSYDCSLPVMDLVLLSSDACYKIDTFEASGVACRTNIEPRTAFRSFGVIQCSLIVEEALEKLAHALKVRPEKIRERNFYQDATPDRCDRTPYGQTLQDCRIREVWRDLKTKSDFTRRERAVRAFNSLNRWRKRGISMIPIKYGVSFTFPAMNQGSAYIMTYEDGSVLVHHGGIEMGQGINTKIARIAADFLGIGMENIQIGESGTNTIPNATFTGASTGTDLNGGAVRLAARQLRERMERFCAASEGASGFPDWKNDWAGSWTKIVRLAYSARLNLSGQANFASPDLAVLGANNQLPEGTRIFYYFSYSAAVSEVEIDVLTGEFSILRSDLIYDAGQSLNSDLDFGQLEGGFVQGIGNVTTEQVYCAEDGRLISNGTWNYKPPCSKTIPVSFNSSLLQYDRTNNKTGIPMDHYGIRSSKSTGEPPLVLANTVFFAIKHAILDARKDAGDAGWFELESPATVERIQQACQISAG